MKQNNEKKTHEPLFHLVKRAGVVWWKAWLIRLIAIVLALVASGLVTYLVTQLNPLEVYKTMIDGAIGTERRTWGFLQNTAILLCISLALTPAFKMRFWNIGGEGQVLMGGLATASCMILLGNKAPPAVLMIVMILASILAAAVWALIPALFKAKWNTNETLFTLMMNYIAIQIVSYFTYIWSVPKGSGQIGTINPKDYLGWLVAPGGKLRSGKEYLVNIIIVAVLTVVMFIYLRYSKHGYEIAVVGESENTARYIGVNVKKVVLRTLLLSGAICGIAGFLLVAGTDHTITRDTAGGRGFTAIMVSWLAKFNPLYMVLTAGLVVFLQKGSTEIATVFGLNNSFSDIITGIIIFFIIGCEFFIQYQFKFRQAGKEVAK